MPDVSMASFQWEQIWPLFLGAAILALVMAVIPTANSTYSHRIVPLLAVATLGFVIGDLTGQSRGSGIAQVISAIVAVLGGVLIYLVGIHGEKKQMLASGAVLVLSIALLLGANWGASIRQYSDDMHSSPAYKVQQELTEMQLRQAVGLPVPPPPDAKPAREANPTP
jgi:peptidoglycan/LPS O-acetylase OafA/YrhL